MANMKYFFEVNRNGDPIEGSNIRTNRPPRSNYKRWKEITPKAQLCCTTGDPVELEVSEGRKVRYWVRLDEKLFPISGTLTKHRVKPVGEWQEVVGIYCCGLILNPTIDEPLNLPLSADPQQVNILTEGNAADPQGATVRLLHNVGDIIESTEGDMTLEIDDTDGTITITQVTPLTGGTNEFTLTMSDGKGHTTTFTFTATFTP
jgi:hypothetical protein